MRMRVKTSIIKLIGLVLIFAITTHCKKVNEDSDVYFYTSNKSTSTLKLYINQKEKGELPVINTCLSAKNDTILCKAIHLKLVPREYKLEVRGENGDVKFSGLFKIQPNYYQTSCTIGQVDNAIADGVLVSRISFN